MLWSYGYWQHCNATSSSFPLPPPPSIQGTANCHLGKANKMSGGAAYNRLGVAILLVTSCHRK